MNHFTLCDGFNTRGQNGGLDAKRRARARGLGKSRIHGVLVVLITGNVRGRTVMHDGDGHGVTRNAYRLIGLSAQGQQQCQP